MSFSSFNDKDGEVLSEINMIPLIDVMLVLLIVFIITVPVIQNAVKVDLPQATSKVNHPQAQVVNLSIDAAGLYHWNEATVTHEQLQERLALAAAQEIAPELHIRGDKSARYEWVAKAMAAAKRAGITKLTFVTQQDTGGAVNP